MKRTLMVALLLSLAACKQEPSAPADPPPAEATPTPVPETPVSPAQEPLAEPPTNPIPPGMEELVKSFERSGPVVGEVEKVATLEQGFVRLLHDVAIAGDYAYVRDAGGMLYRAPITGGALEVVHDSERGAGEHAWALASDGRLVLRHSLWSGS